MGGASWSPLLVLSDGRKCFPRGRCPVSQGCFCALCVPELCWASPRAPGAALPSSSTAPVAPFLVGCVDRSGGPGLQPGAVTSHPNTVGWAGCCCSPSCGSCCPSPHTHTLTQSLLSFLGVDLRIWERGGKKRRMLISGSDVYLHTNTGTSATVPPLSKQQLPAQARLCLQTCLLRSLPCLPGGAVRSTCRGWGKGGQVWPQRD